MLRKTYQLMQKTRGLMEDAGEQMFRMGGYVPRGGVARKPASYGVPVSFLVSPPFLWAVGDVKRGADLARFAVQSQHDFLQNLFSPSGSRDLDPTFHSFQWMRDLMADGGDTARRGAAKLTALWMRGNDVLPPDVMDPTVSYQRIRHIAAGYEFYQSALSSDEQSVIVSGTMNHLYPLKRALQSGGAPIDLLHIAASILTIGIVTGMPAYDMNAVLKQMDQIVGRVVLVDGGPITRRPSDLPDLLKMFVELRHVFEAASIPVPSFIAHAIDKMAPALRALRLGDGGMAVFHGGSVSTPMMIDEILHYAGGSVGMPATLPYTGFERLAAGPSMIVVDAGRAVMRSGQHASTTAFEWSAAAVRVVVNCGKHATDPLWGDLLAATSAHSTVTMGHQDNVPVTGLADVDILRDDRNGSMVEVIHNGYQTRNGFIHARKISLSRDGLLLGGEDRMETSVPPLEPLDYTIRFHLHPDVSSVLVHSGPREKSMVSLTLPDGAVWEFRQDGDQIALEDSVYLGDTGKPAKSRQIVISGQITQASKKVQWRFEAV